MKRLTKSITWIAVAGLLACSESNRNPAPVELLVSGTQQVLLIDLLDPDQNNNIGTIEIRAVAKSSSGTIPNDPRFLDVKLLSYRVSYRRTDGGKTVPASFVRTMSGIIPVGGQPTPLNDVIIFTSDAILQAPFVALFPNNGGIDPETGQRIVKLDVIIDIFGVTLSGQNVSVRDVSPIWVCAGCSL